MKDIDELNEERKKNPEEPLWATLARLGWVPPSTWQATIQHTHDLEMRLRGVSAEPAQTPV